MRRPAKLISLLLLSLAPACGSPVDDVPDPTTQAVTAPLSSIEQQLVDAVNQQRAANGLAALAVDARLEDASRTHNNLQSQTNTMSHQLPGELPVCAAGPNNDRLDAVGYDWFYCGENVAYGYGTVASVMNAWMNSAGHRANILNVNYRDIGVAYNPTGNFWTQDFGKATSATQPITPPPPAPPPPTCTTNTLASGAALAPGGSIGACNGKARLIHQGDGNVVLYAWNNAPLWYTSTNGRSTSTFAMQTDGNLVLYSTAGTALWHSHTYGNPGAWLKLQDDCNLVIWSADGTRALWQTGTRCP